jgi:hypothetical protein
VARNLHIYPKAVLDGSTWTLIVKVYEPATRITSRFKHLEAAGVTANEPTRLLKVAWDMVVADTDTDQDVDDALYVDDIRPGPQVETVWGNWRDEAESIIGGLAGGWTQVDFEAGWTSQATNGMRQDARRALITQRGWTIVAGSVQQTEGDGTETVE